MTDFEITFSDCHLDGVGEILDVENASFKGVDECGGVIERGTAMCLRLDEVRVTTPTGRVIELEPGRYLVHHTGLYRSVF